MATVTLDTLPEITFDVRSRRWRYRDSKVFAPMAAVRTQAQRYATREKQVLRRIGQDYSEGKIDLETFQRQAAQTVKHIHLADMVRALDKQEQLSPDKFLLVARNVKRQYHSGKDPLSGDRFGLKYLAQDIAAGKVSPAQLLNRLSMFGESGKVTFWGTKTALATDDGKSKAMRVLGAAEHCQHCPVYAAMGWVPISELILPTQRCECRTNCKCSVRYR